MNYNNHMVDVQVQLEEFVLMVQRQVALVVCDMFNLLQKEMQLTLEMCKHIEEVIQVDQMKLEDL
jgi:hypothetical protein